MASVTVDIDVSEVLREASELDLLGELLRRSLTKRERDLFLKCLSSRSISDLLTMFQVPSDLIKPIEDYFHQPIADLQALQRWNESCGVTP